MAAVLSLCEFAHCTSSMCVIEISIYLVVDYRPLADSFILSKCESYVDDKIFHSLWCKFDNTHCKHKLPCVV